MSAPVKEKPTFLIRFEDGPLAGQTRQSQLDWPLPDEIAAHINRMGVVFAVPPFPSNMPKGAVIYGKTSESQPPADIPHVQRGAVYEVKS